MKQALRWEKSGKVYIAVDDANWKRYIVFQNVDTWHAVGPIGWALNEFWNTNRRKLMASILWDWRSRQ